MHISAQISLYPLRQEHLSPAITAVKDLFEKEGLHPRVGPMSTVVEGESDVVFSALHKAFIEASENGQIVLTITVSNACPVIRSVE